MIFKHKNYFSFDCEAVGLYGSTFAFGYCVVDGESRKELEADMFVSSFDEAVHETDNCGKLLNSDYDWVVKNVLPAVGHKALWENRKASFRQLAIQVKEVIHKWTNDDTVFVVDCPFPVETNFLSSLMKQYGGFHPQIVSPYPIIDVGTARLMAGLNPIESTTRLESELPIHNPLADARQSIRLFFEAVDIINGRQNKS